MKKILTKLLLIVLVISLPVACSNVENAGQDTDKANETVTEEDSTAKEEEGALEVPDTEEPQNELSFMKGSQSSTRKRTCPRPVPPICPAGEALT